jgi:hypothetical protein
MDILVDTLSQIDMTNHLIQIQNNSRGIVSTDPPAMVNSLSYFDSLISAPTQILEGCPRYSRHQQRKSTLHKPIIQTYGGDTGAVRANTNCSLTQKSILVVRSI